MNDLPSSLASGSVIDDKSRMMYPGAVNGAETGTAVESASPPSSSVSE